MVPPRTVESTAETPNENYGATLFTIEADNRYLYIRLSHRRHRIGDCCDDIVSYQLVGFPNSDVRLQYHPFASDAVERRNSLFEVLQGIGCPCSASARSVF
jgi:hypothetical protein